MGISSEDIFKTNKLLIDEDRVPFQDSFFNHVFLIHYLENCYNTQLSLREITTNRGSIYDTNGHILAMSVPKKTLCINFRKIYMSVS